MKKEPRRAESIYLRQPFSLYEASSQTMKAPDQESPWSRVKPLRPGCERLGEGLERASSMGGSPRLIRGEPTTKAIHKKRDTLTRHMNTKATTLANHGV